MIQVLYVDDEPDLLEIGTIYLERTGHFTVDTAASAQLALEKIPTKPYDAIISDYQMPGMDGIAFLKEVRAGFGNIPFILFTGRGREEVVIEALNCGADFYLQKGGDPQSQFAELAHKVRTAVQHRNAEERIIVQNRLYSVLSATNKAIVHIRNKPEFFSEICRILVEIGGFRMVWIGLADTIHKRIEPVASFGHTDGYLEYITISTEDVPDGRGPAGTAYREGTYIYGNDVKTDPRMEPWREAAVGRGYLANAAFPFALGTRDAGVISLYAPKTGFFDEQVISLLAEVSRDISFALRTIDEEEHRKSAEEALRENRERLSLALKVSGMGTFDWDIPHNIWTWDDQAYRLLVVEPGTFSGTTDEFFRIVHPDDWVAVRAAFAQAVEEKTPYETEFRVVWPDGSVHTIAARGVINYDNEGRAVWLTGICWDITEQRQAEDILKTRDRIFNHSLDLLCIAGFDGYLKVLNPAWSKTLGWSIEELLAKPWLEFVHPEDRDSTVNVRSVLVDGEEVFQFENRYLCKDGSYKWLSWNSFPYPEEKIIFAVARDVTDHKRIEESLQESEQRFHTLFDHTIDGIALHELIVDRSGAATEYRILEVNPAYETLLGIRRETILGKTSREAYGTTEPPYLDIYSRVALGGAPISFETFFPPMEKHFYISVYSPLPGYFATVFEDVTERKRADYALRESEERFRGLVDTVTSGVAIYEVRNDGASGRDYIIREFNRMALEIEGKTKEEVIEKSLADLSPSIDEYGIIPVLQRVWKTGVPEYYPEKIYVDEQYANWYESRVFRLQNGEIVVVYDDVTEQKRSEAALRQANRQLNLLGGMSRHDILNLVSVLLGYAAIARMTPSDPSMVAFIDKVESVTKRIGSQIEFTRVYQDLGTQAPQWQALDPILPRSHMPDTVTLHADVPDVEVYADPMLEKVFYNLLDNSIRHGQQVTEIRVSMTQSEAGLTIVWEDNGVGVPDADKERIFERGFGENTGFGLFLVREILSLTDISIRETGTTGKGARFEITVPKGGYRSSLGTVRPP